MARLNPFSGDLVDQVMQAGQTITEILAELGIGGYPASFVLVTVEGDPVFADFYHRIRPKPGTLVTVRVVPRGGVNLRMILGIVVALAAIAIAGPLGGALGFGALGTSLLTAGLGIAGNLALNALVPPPRQSVAAVGGGSETEPLVSAITGVRNRVLRYGTIPKQFGRVKVFPPAGASSFTELVGEDQYLRFLFVFGFGPLQIDEIKIGATPIGDFADVEFELRQGFATDPPLTLYTNDVTEDLISVALTQSGSWQQRTALQAADELSVDITFPGGLVQFTDAGGKLDRTVQVEVEYRAVGGGSWIAAGTLTVTAARANTVRRGLRWTVTLDTYEVRLRRITADSTDTKIRDEVNWTSLRAFRNQDPINMPGLAMIAGRIKATGQLNGFVDTLNAEVTSILPVWDGAAWTDQATANPAWAFVDILSGSANKRPVDRDTRINLAEILAWAGENDAAGREINLSIDAKTPVFNLLRDVASLGRGSPDIIDGKYTVVRDKPQTVPVQKFTPRNSSKFEGQRIYEAPPHALRVRFINPATGWQQDEVLVFDDGFNAGNATLFEILELKGVTDSDQAWKAGRFHLADMRLRSERFTITVDFEHLLSRKGSLVDIAHDAALIGLGSGRIKSVETDGGGGVTAVTLDERLTFEDAVTYAARTRLADGTDVERNLVTVAGDSVRLEFFTAVPVTETLPAVGDLVLVGEVGKIALEAIVTKIEPQSDLAARLTLMPAAAAVHSADTGTIPAHNPVITLPPDLLPPPDPVILAVISDESVIVRAPDGSFQPRIVVDFRSSGARGAAVVGYELQFKRASEVNWQPLASLPGDAFSASIDTVETGVFYDIRLRAQGANGRASAWVTVSDHQVVGLAAAVAPPSSVLLSSGTQSLFRKADGTVVTRMRVVWTASPDAFVLGYDVEFKRTADAAWTTVGRVAPDIAEAFAWEVEEGINYDARVRSVSLRASSDPAVAGGHLVVGKSEPPGDVALLIAQQNGNAVIFRWEQIPDADLSHYEIRRSSLEIGLWEDADVISQPDAGTSHTVADVAPGDHRFYIKAVDSSGNASALATLATLKVVSDFDVIFGVDQHPLWPGTRQNVIVHPSGALVPQSAGVAADDGDATFDSYVPNPLPGIYTAPAIGLVVRDRVRIWADTLQKRGPGQPGFRDARLQMRHNRGTDDTDEQWSVGDIEELMWTAGDNGDEFWVTWTEWADLTIGEVEAQAIQHRLVIDETAGLPVVEAFTAVVDVLPRTERQNGLSVASGGSTITFKKRFHEPPSVDATAAGSAARIAVPEAITDANFSVRVFDKDGADVGGTINYSAGSE